MWYKLSGVIITGIGVSVLQREAYRNDGGSWLVTPQWVQRRFPSVSAAEAKQVNKVSGQVVLVTGGAGFLGQHIIKQLQERAEFVKEIRVLDLQPYINTLGHEEKKPVKSINGDICEFEHVRKAVAGVDAVIHAAAVVSAGLFPDKEFMDNVNVKGTENVVNACIAESVPKLVFTSATDVVVGYNSIENGDESLPVADPFLFDGFPESKAKAEKVVTEAHGKNLAKGGGQLSTIILRPNVMYGECDASYIPKALETAKQRKGKLPVIGSCKSQFQHAYVGNVAWAHVVALHALNHAASRSTSPAGETYFITDNTPICNVHVFMAKFLDVCDMHLAANKSSYRLLYPMLTVYEAVLRLIEPVYKVNMRATKSSLIYMNRTYCFDRSKAEKLLGYAPLYTWDESFVMSANYYMSLEL